MYSFTFVYRCFNFLCCFKWYSWLCMIFRYDSDWSFLMVLSRWFLQISVVFQITSLCGSVQLFFLQYSALPNFLTLSLQLRDPTGSFWFFLPASEPRNSLEAVNWGREHSHKLFPFLQRLPIDQCLQNPCFIYFHPFNCCLRQEGKSSPWYSIEAWKQNFPLQLSTWIVANIIVQYNLPL